MLEARPEAGWVMHTPTPGPTWMRRPQLAWPALLRKAEKLDPGYRT